MDEQQPRSVREITDDFICEFAELNLEIVRRMRADQCYDVVLLRELRENAQALESIATYSNRSVLQSCTPDEAK